MHAFVLFCQVITLNVAINGSSSTLFALMVSNNFVELKGSVFKKFAIDNLFAATCGGNVQKQCLAYMLHAVLKPTQR
jgi:transmembrane anterior posterior transformation protein 1